MPARPDTFIQHRPRWRAAATASGVIDHVCGGIAGPGASSGPTTATSTSTSPPPPASAGAYGSAPLTRAAAPPAHGRRHTLRLASAQLPRPVQPGDHPKPDECAGDEVSGCTAPRSPVLTAPTSSLPLRLTLAQLGAAKRRGRPSSRAGGVARAAQNVKMHGQAWNRLASVRIMSSSRDDANISLARRIADAVATANRDEAIRLTRELEQALTSTPDQSAHAAPSFTAQPALAPDDVYADAVAQRQVTSRNTQVKSHAHVERPDTVSARPANPRLGEPGTVRKPQATPVRP
jgi:hypothetical protein